MKTMVIYRSKSGFVKKYAEWIAQALTADLYEASNVTPKMLASYDTIIYGGGLYAVGIHGIKLIKDNLPRLQGKTVVVFASGASPARDDVINEVKNKNFTLEQQKQIRFFYMQGGFNFSKLKTVDKILMTLMKWMIKSKKERTPDDQGLLAAYDQPIDFTREENINPLVAYVVSAK